MSVVLDRPDISGRATGRAELSLFGDGVGGEPTLDEILSGAWEGLAARRSVGCPVCDGEMASAASGGGDGVVGRCGSCGTQLS